MRARIAALASFCTASIVWVAAVGAQAPLNLGSEPGAVRAQGSFRPASTPFSDTFCLNVKFAQGQPLDDLPMLEDLGVKWVRDLVPWTAMEREPERYRDFPIAFYKRLAYYRTRGIGVVYLLGMDNPVAYPNSPSSPANSANPYRFARFASFITRSLRAAGVNFVLEIWNEPHNSALQKIYGGNWQGARPSPWVDQYVKLVNATVEAVHKVDRRVQLLSDDDMWIVHYWFLESGLSKELAGLAFHPYAATPELTAVAPDTSWTKPFTVVDPDRAFGSAVRRLRERGREKLGHEPAMWITEWGWPATVPGSEPPQDVSEEVARFLPRAFVLAAAAGVKATCWFSAQDSVDGPMGLTTNRREARPAYVAYRSMNKALGTLALVAHVIGTEEPTRGLQVYRFEGGGSTRWIAWAVDGEYQLSLPTPTARAWDVYGVELSNGTRGSTVRIDGSPIYLEGVSDAELKDGLHKRER